MHCVLAGSSKTSSTTGKDREKTKELQKQYYVIETNNSYSLFT